MCRFFRASHSIEFLSEFVRVSLLDLSFYLFKGSGCKGAITSKIKLAIKLKTSPARLAQLLQPSLAFCFSLQLMTAYLPVLDGTQDLF